MTVITGLMILILQSARNIDHRLTVVETKMLAPSSEIVRLQVWFADMDRAMMDYHPEYRQRRTLGFGGN